MQLSDLKGKNIAVWGLGKEGLSVVELLIKRQLPKNLYIYNDTPLEKISSYPQVKIYSGEDFAQLLPNIDVIIKSPGVSIYKDNYKLAQKAGVLFTTSSDLFLSEMRANHPGTIVIGVTGSKGKSTTASLLYTALNHLDQDVVLAGNIGRPLIDLIEEEHRFVVAELSSYQCSDLSTSPQIVLFTNLFPEHIDWHLNHDNYYRDKVHLVAHQQKGDACFVNDKCEKLKKYCNEYTRDFNYYNIPKAFAEIDNILCYNEKPILHIEEIKLEGYHNLDNMAGVLSVINYLGFDVQKAIESFKKFEALPHRLQKIGEKDGVLFINDSISTAPETAMAAIKSFDQEMGIFLGGFERQQDYTELAQFINDTPRIKVVATLFQTGPRIAQTIRKIVTRKDLILIEEPDFTTAVGKLFDELKDQKGKLALFSPAAPSYDAYKSFEFRGYEFIKIFEKL